MCPFTALQTESLSTGANEIDLWILARGYYHTCRCCYLKRLRVTNSVSQDK